MKLIKPVPEGYLFTGRDLARLIGPLFVEQFLIIAVGLADSIMVASVGEAAVSAVSLIDTIMVLIINLFVALGTGGAIVAGQALGRRAPEDGRRAAEQTLLLSATSSLAVMALMYGGKWFILHVVFGSIEPAVMANCNTYLMIVAASIPFVAVYNSGAAMFRAMGDSGTPMRMSLVMNAVNLGGNAVLLYGLGFGIEGAAIPTLASRVLAGVWMLALIQRERYTLHVRTLVGLRFHLPVLRNILHVGVPYAMENSMFQLGKIIVLSLVSGFGTASIAANAVGNSVCTFAILGGVSINYALSSVTAQCVGAGDFDQVRCYTRRLMSYAYGGLLLTNAVIFLLLPVIILAYHLSPETAGMARAIIVLHGVCAMLIWAPAFTLPNTLRAASDVTFCMVVSVLSMWIFRIGFSYLLGRYAGLGLFGVWTSMILDWVCRSACFIFRYRGTRWIHTASLIGPAG